MTEAAFTEQPNVQESFDESIPDLREFEPEPESQTAIAEGELPDWLTGSVQTENELADLSQPGIETLELSDADIDEIAATEFPFLDMEETKARQMETQTEPSTPEESTKPEITESPDQTFLKFSSDIAKIPGISASDAEKLRLAGITAPLLLLRKGATEQDRMSIADEIGVDKTKVLNWVNYVDILRVKGLSIEDAAALYKAGIRMIADLAMSDPSTLQEQLEAVAEEMDFDYQSPAVDQIENWIEQAKQLPRVVTYL
jgi:predicted flap endonuclease-1-like 5' DNA nuclease